MVFGWSKVYIDYDCKRPIQEQLHLRYAARSECHDGQNILTRYHPLKTKIGSIFVTSFQKFDH